VQGLASYIIRRLAWAPVILLVVSLATFALGRFGPGDPIQILQGQYRDPEVRERIAEERGYNDNFFVQYRRYVEAFAKGDMGTSLTYRGLPVKDVIFPRLWVTIQYNFVALALIFGIGIPAGIWAALRQGTWMDPFTISFFLFFASVPVLVSIPILQWLFALKLGWLPSGGWEVRDYFGVEIGVLNKRAILPVIVLTLPGVAGVARYMRAQVLEVLDQDFVRTARAKGLAEFTVVSASSPEGPAPDAEALADELVKLVCDPCRERILEHQEEVSASPSPPTGAWSSRTKMCSYGTTASASQASSKRLSQGMFATASPKPRSARTSDAMSASCSITGP